MFTDRFAGLASAVGIILILTLIAWLDLWGPVNWSAIKEWQTLVGFGGTIGVGIVAWINVSRQIHQQKAGTRLTLLSREEDRIETDLPGLKDAALFCEQLTRKLKSSRDIDYIMERLRRTGIAVSSDLLRKAVVELLPSTEDRTRRLLIARIQRLVTRVAAAHVIYSCGKSSNPGDDEVILPLDLSEQFDEKMDEVRQAVEEVELFGAKLRSDVRWTTRRLSRIREEIETHTN